ncbi:hypothetical protein NLX62_00340 [Mycobacteriaceae bacterium Msp059]|nr:hypothetical protein [Mycobacteriaceae bacterium Msp059]
MTAGYRRLDYVEVDGVQVIDHRPNPARTGNYGYQAFFDTHAADPSPWSIEDMLPNYVLADRAIPQLPGAWVRVIPETRDIDNRIRDRLVAIAIPTMPYQWTPHMHGTIVGDPPPWMRAHREALGLPVDDHPLPDTGVSGDRVLLILSMIALGAIVVWIVLGATR